MKKTTIYILFFLLLACESTDNNKAEIINHMINEVTYLSSDKLEGRETGTNGEKMAAEYISKKFEEYGLIGGVVVLLLYLLFYQRIIVLSIKSQEDFPRLLLLGLGSIVMFQALLHMGVSVNLIPVTGQTLPLISKGGSSVWVTSLAFGIIINISHQINNQINTHNA